MGQRTFAVRPVNLGAVAVALALVSAMLGSATAVTTPAASSGETLVGPVYTGTTAPTGEKPQSKLWVAHGQWWGVLWDVGSQDFHIFRYDDADGTWHDTGVLVDERSTGRVDALWDGVSLYIASAGTNAGTVSHSPRLTKYQYDAATNGWVKESGYPVPLGNGGVEATVLTKDSTGMLWATYTRGSSVLVTHSAPGDDKTWVPAYQLPVPAAAGTVEPGDISAIVSFDGDKVGVLWNNSITEKMYWAAHVDGDVDTAWSTQVVYDYPEGADDHINLKSLAGDSAGRVFAVLKTSFDHADDPLINLLVLDRAGQWSSEVFATKGDNLTRAIVLLDSENRHLYVLAAGPCCSGGKIYYKRTSLDDPQFEPGLGTVFMEHAGHVKINNPTSTKQNLSSATGLLVLAGDDGTRTYVHRRLQLGSGPPPDTEAPVTTIESGPPASTPGHTAEFVFSANEPATYECALDDAAFSSCSSPATYSGLSAGSHGFEVRATDLAGNVDATPAGHAWTIDPDVEPMPLFVDDFGSGGFTSGGWLVSTGADGAAAVEAGAVRADDPGARLTSSSAAGSTASIRRDLDSPAASLAVGFDARLAVQGKKGQTYGLAKIYDDRGNRVLTLSRDSSTGALSVADRDAAGPPFASLGTDHVVRVSIRVTQNGTAADSVEVTIAGSVAFSSDTMDLGGLDFGRLRLGDDSLRRVMDLRVDNVEVRP